MYRFLGRGEILFSLSLVVLQAVIAAQSSLFLFLLQSAVLCVHFVFTINLSLIYVRLCLCILLLYCAVNRAQVGQLFDFVDIDDSKEIEYKEFLVALTTGHVLETIQPGDGFDDNAKITLSNGMQTTNSEIKTVLNLIVSAYLLFDPKGNGFIDRKSVGGLIDEGGSGVNSNAMLSKERWDEMVCARGHYLWCLCVCVLQICLFPCLF